MNEFKKCLIVMLSTNEKAENCLVMYDTNNLILKYQPNQYYTQEYLKSIYCKSHHLYILSNDEIKEGDMVMRICDNLIHKQHSDLTVLNNLAKEGLFKKAIASTDKSLNLPQPSQQFIEKYISEYNKNNKIEEIMVEYKDNMDTFKIEEGHFCIELDLKVNPKDNTITIKKVKSNWNREELLVMLEEAFEAGLEEAGNYIDEIKENL